MNEQQAEALRVARALINAGIPVFTAEAATYPDGRWRPDGGSGGCGYWLPSGWQDTTPDPAVVDQWRPGMALCAVMGHGLDLLDVDPRHGGDKTKAGLQSAGMWPNVYGHAYTPSGGTHDFIASLGVGSRDGVRSGLDVKAGTPTGKGRGFAFIAPTVRLSKTTGELTEYRWAEAPDLDMLAIEGTDDDTGAGLAHMVTKAKDSRKTTTGNSPGEEKPAGWFMDGPIPAGKRHRTLLAFSGWLRRVNTPYDLARKMLHQRWQECEQGAEPYTWGEAERLLTDVYKRHDPTYQDVETLVAPIVNDGPDAEEDAPRRRVLFQPVSQIKRRRRQYLWENRLPLGEMTLWVGHAGIGKSQAAVWLASAVSNGTLPGELQGTPAPVLYLATEDSWEYTLAPRFDAAGGDSETVYRIYSETEEGTEGTISLSVDLDGLREAIHQTGARLVVLDALLSTFGGAKLTEQGVVRRHMEPLARLAQELNIAVVGVAHFRKANDPNPLHMIAGSAEFGQVVRSAIGFAPDPEAEDGSCVLSVVKSNIASKDTPSIRYRIEPGVVETEDGPTDVGRFMAVGETDQNVADLLNAERGSAEERSERAEASEWLVAYLADNGGEAIAGDVIRDADKAGFAKHTIQRARKKAGVKSQKSGLKGGWAWVLDTITDRDAEGDSSPEDDPKNTKVTRKQPLSSSSSSVSPSGQTPEQPSLSAVEDGATATCRTPGCNTRVALDAWPDGHCYDHQTAA